MPLAPARTRGIEGHIRFYARNINAQEGSGAGQDPLDLAEEFVHVVLRSLYTQAGGLLVEGLPRNGCAVCHFNSAPKGIDVSLALSVELKAAGIMGYAISPCKRNLNAPDHHPGAGATLPVHPIARMLVQLSTTLMTDYELHCPNCGLPSARGSGHCSCCGYEFPLTVEILANGTGGPVSTAVPWNVGHIALALFLFVAVLFAAAFGARAIGPLYPEQETALETWVAVHLLAAGIGLVVWFAGVHRAQRPFNALGMVKPRTSWLVTALLAAGALGFSILATFVYGFVVDRLGLDALRPPDIRTEALFPGIALLLTFQALALITPISEEILFRGFVLRGLLNQIGAGPAVVSTALVFSALHFDAGTIIPIFFTGLALGWLYVKTGSLWPCIAAHAGQNALALLAVWAGL